MSFVRKDEPVPPAVDIAASLEGPCFEIPADRIFSGSKRPGRFFGEAAGPILFGPDGTICSVKTGEDRGPEDLLEAAFELACAWAKRYTRMEIFPAGLDEHRIFAVTPAGMTAVFRAMPVVSDSGDLGLDVWIYGADGEIVEGAIGVKLRDASDRPVPAPQSADDRTGEGPLRDFTSACQGYCLIELRTIVPFAHLSFSPSESETYATLGRRRKGSYAAARVALKRLGRKLSPGLKQADARSLETIEADGIHPTCMGSGLDNFTFSASHDDRFVVAVAGKGRIGVDVERMSDKMIRGMRYYMSSEERELAKGSSLGELHAAARVWTLKEAAAKALDLSLVRAWSAVAVGDIGATRSTARIGSNDLTAVHVPLDEHVFTLLELPMGFESP